MQKIQLYIEGQRLELFKDESVSLTDSIQNIKDVSKIFTAFTKSFTIPASKNNNKIFKHYYNYNIENGFDARLKKASNIELNSLPYKVGKLKLNSVSLKNNIPYSYNVTFFGDTVILKDVLGEDNLDALNWLDNFNILYSPSINKANLQNGSDFLVDSVTYNDALIVPLISHTNRFVYESNSHTQIEGIENLWYESGNGQSHQHGVSWDDLKYSIRIHIIIKAIEKKYTIANGYSNNIVFSDDFFNTTESAYHNLYMWMHRKKGNVQGNVVGTPLYSKLITSFTPSGTSGIPAFYNDGTAINIFTSTNKFQSELTLTTSSIVIYNVVVRNSSGEYLRTNNLSGTQTINIGTPYMPQSAYTVTIESPSAITFSEVKWNVTSQFQSGYSVDLFSGAVSVTEEFIFYPTQQLPEIKIIDFLTGLFKMFNLTAYLKDDEIKVDTLDNFYADYNIYDISKYIDVNLSSVDVALPYRQIDFIYEDYKTYLASIFNQLNNQQFGELKYRGEETDNWDGEIYKVSLPFQKLMYEKLTNANGGWATTIQYGWMADSNSEPYIGKPLLHYVYRKINGTPISFRDSVTSHSSLITYYVPLNTDGILSTSQSLNFKSEINEYTLLRNDETLFKNYYLNYIKDIFNKSRRIIKVKAFLPLRILLNYKLSDKFIINGQSYLINSINTNLKSGKSDLELLNDL